MPPISLVIQKCAAEMQEGTMKKIKFVVKLNRRGFRVPEYVQRIDRTPVQMTTNRKRALVMGRLTAEDVVKSIDTFQCIPELASVEVSA
jgi:hypothetical protein